MYLHDSVQIGGKSVQKAVEKALAEFFSPTGLAEWLEVPVRSVYRWNHTGAGPRPIRVGKHIRYRRSDVEAWLQSQSASGTPAA